LRDLRRLGAGYLGDEEAREGLAASKLNAIGINKGADANRRRDMEGLTELLSGGKRRWMYFQNGRNGVEGEMVVSSSFYTQSPYFRSSNHRTVSEVSNNSRLRLSSSLFTAPESNVEHSCLTVSDNHRPMLTGWWSWMYSTKIMNDVQQNFETTISGPMRLQGVAALRFVCPRQYPVSWDSG
jgi:hypothetical protein